ncbi:hypothetical protein NQ318_017724 [Aromia moschata]|uniref:Uncharacterized protein n=1 Tax=Aromia moschata TaxID=1265417 RepID=A0AAV8XP14_9CUCU|nr:hypothetical protein NQ318_017724 [Aromia moschata]
MMNVKSFRFIHFLNTFTMMCTHVEQLVSTADLYSEPTALCPLCPLFTDDVEAPTDLKALTIFLKRRNPLYTLPVITIARREVPNYGTYHSCSQLDNAKLFIQNATLFERLFTNQIILNNFRLLTVYYQ